MHIEWNRMRIYGKLLLWISQYTLVSVGRESGSCGHLCNSTWQPRYSDVFLRWGLYYNVVTGPVVDFTTSQARASCKTKLLSSQFMVPFAIWSNAYFSCYRGSEPLAHAALRLNGRNVHDFIVRWYSELLVAEQQQNESRRRSQFHPMAWIMLLNGRARCYLMEGLAKPTRVLLLFQSP